MTLTFNPSKDSYTEFQKSLHDLLKTRREVRNIPVMVEQTGNNPPPRWVLLRLTGSTNIEDTTLAVRNDNIYLTAFNNSEGTWFSFERYLNIVPRSTLLPKPLTENYGGLLHAYGGRDGLKSFDMGMSAALESVRNLSTYKLSNDPDTNAKLGLSLARLCVIIAESARFNTVYSMVQRDVRLTDKETWLVIAWGKTSMALLKWDKGEKWKSGDEMKKAGILTPEDAEKVLRLIIWPSGYHFDAAA